jgi:hypothetical protein
MPKAGCAMLSRPTCEDREMNLPTIPTDNFYKFMAISGVAIVIFSFAFPMTLIKDLRPKQIKIMTKQKVMKLELDELLKEQDILSKDIAVAETNLENLTSENVVKLRERQVDLHQNVINIKIKTINIEGQIDMIGALTEELHFAKILMICGVIIGLIFSFCGFVAWYFIVQIPSDLLLRRQVEGNQIEISEHSHKKGLGG